MNLKNTRLTVLCCLAAILTSCVTPMDNPKAASLQVNEMLSFGDGVILKRFTLPPGLYPYTKTIREGHLYQRPELGTLRDTGIPFKQEGGVLWRHGKPQPDRLYRKTLPGFLAFMPNSSIQSKITVNPGSPAIITGAKP